MPKRLIWIAVLAFLLAATFCVGFVYFYGHAQRAKLEAPPADESRSFINKPLPQARLVDTSGATVDEAVIRKGRVVLVFVTPECDACRVESDFLQTILDRRSDVTFVGLIPFGKRLSTQQASQKMFPFQVFYDDGDTLVSSIGINKVPVKIFLEDGIIKKGWIGAATSEAAKVSFTNWLDGLP